MWWGSPHAFGSVGTLGELRWLHLYRLTPDLVGLRRFAVWLWSSGRFLIFPVRHSARLHGDHFVSFPDSCVSIPHIYLGVQFLGLLPIRVTGWTLCPPPLSSRILSFAWTYSPVTLILMHPAIDLVLRCPCLPRLRML